MNELLIGTAVGIGTCGAGVALTLAYQWTSDAIRSKFKGTEAKQKLAIKEALKEYEAEATIDASGKTKIK